ncbi:ferredoxin--NADP reductase [Aldersonia kunmingensis]|uniref:ferredoxin--NADP reductase n=1 Tax=Aldersonia kunmingensis TaxID=408066 RepID=UPI000836C799|nr:ferredoxin--NADP reductase [Aldersonia kunmingensis]
MARPPVFQRATVSRVVKETADARTYVLAPQDGSFAYRAGQFCTFRVRVDGTDLYRSYSMSSAPETDDELMTTVKRVPGGQVSNWLHDNLAEGDEVELTRPAGTFVLRESDAPLLGFAGGSGITPILSLAKSVLATTDRQVRLLCADRDRDAAIFADVLGELVERYPGRLSVVRHFDAGSGLLSADAVRAFVADDGHADAYLCGPEAFMAMVESALSGPGPVYSERFGTAAEPIQPTETTNSNAERTVTNGPETSGAATNGAVVDETVTIILNKKKVTVPRTDNGETILESARRAGLAPPFSCEAGNCATCIAKLLDGKATMRVNDALDEDEVEEGYILTCQAVPDCTVVVDYE